MSEQTLYQRVGGYDAIAAATDDALPRLLKDPEIKAYFDHMSQDSIRKLRQHFVDFLVEAAGGPAYYIGRDMRTTHVGMGITEGQWQAFVADIGATLEHLHVPARETGEFAALMETLKQEIVESRADPATRAA
jgi:hemoglobin